MENKKYYLVILMIGVFLQSICILGGSIYGLGSVNDVSQFLFKLILLPNILSYALIILGLCGSFIKTGKN